MLAAGTALWRGVCVLWSGQRLAAGLSSGERCWAAPCLDYRSLPATLTRPLPRAAQAGFREQTRSWPVQPVDQAIRWLRGRPAGWVVADLGCGDAKIAATVQQVRAWGWGDSFMV